MEKDHQFEIIARGDKTLKLRSTVNMGEKMGSSMLENEVQTVTHFLEVAYFMSPMSQ